MRSKGGVQMIIIIPLMGKMVITERNSTLRYKNKPRLLQQNIML